MKKIVVMLIVSQAAIAHELVTKTIQTVLDLKTNNAWALSKELEQATNNDAKSALLERIQTIQDVQTDACRITLALTMGSFLLTNTLKDLRLHNLANTINLFVVCPAVCATTALAVNNYYSSKLIEEHSTRRSGN